MGTPFKMKGSPMQRNFGISPVKDNGKMKKEAKQLKPLTSDSTEQVTTDAGANIGVVKSKAMIRLESNKPTKDSPGYDAWLKAWNAADARNKAAG
jgi:hypothetical protein